MKKAIKYIFILLGVVFLLFLTMILRPFTIGAENKAIVVKGIVSDIFI